ncbi:MAG: ATP-dependent helicase [Synechococcales cyanobacterium RM1_1_8]|nr:ATP-dependent helicase [Synechococcales cyanobacterium RM1_1_8]
MVQSYADQEAQRDKLIDAYWDCTTQQQLMLQLYSIIYTGAARKRVLNCLDNLELDPPLNPSQVNGDFAALESAKLLVSHRQQGMRCNRLIVEMVTRDAIADGNFHAFAEVVLAEFPLAARWQGGPVYYANEDEFLRMARLDIYGEDLDRFEQHCAQYEQYFHRGEMVRRSDVIERIVNQPFDGEWFQGLGSDRLRQTFLIETLQSAAHQGKPAIEAFDQLVALGQSMPTEPAEASATDPASAAALLAELAHQQLLRGDLAGADQTLQRLGHWVAVADAPGSKLLAQSAKKPEPAKAGQAQAQPFRAELAEAQLQGWLALLRGDYEAAAQHYEAQLKALRKAQGKRKIHLSGLPGVFHILLLLHQNSAASLKQASDHAQWLCNQPVQVFYGTYLLLANLIQVQQGNLEARDNILTTFSQKQGMRERVNSHCIETLFHALAVYWLDPDQGEAELSEALAQQYRHWASGDYHWLALEAAELLARFEPGGSYPLQAQILREESQIVPLNQLLQPRATWEIQLSALANLYQPGTGSQAEVGPSQRLAWMLTVFDQGFALQPKEQKINAKGSWSRGRAVSIKRLAQSRQEFGYLSDQDHRICDQIEVDRYGYSGYSSSDYEFGDRALLALIDHPHVFWEDTSDIRVEILGGMPEVRVLKQGDDRLKIEFFPPLQGSQTIVWHKESPTRLRIFEISDEHRHIAEVLGNSLQVPAAAEAQVLEAIQTISKAVIIQSDIGGGDQAAEALPTISTPHLHLLPAGEGLKVSLLCRPFGDQGPYYRPGQGGETVIADLDGRRVKTERRLDQEIAQAEALVAACPQLATTESDALGEWLLEEPIQCLELLSELQEIGDQAILEWPQGEKLKVSRRTDLDSLQLRLQRQGDWFGASGEIQVSDDQVVDMQRLLELLSQSKGRFVQLDDGQFLALSESFRQRLQELEAFSERSKKGLRIHPLASAALEDWVDEIGDLKADKAWKDHVKRLRQLDQFEPKLPSTLQAELRDYQLDGFRWLARLAHWGVGACLADDMGLGKTLQALALILTRAPQGPTLVLAPTSVGFNWMAEAQKFAPTLQPISLGSGKREEILDNLQPFDLVICTYGLLQQPKIAEMLAQVEWETIVLDEAQAIKNASTNRSKAAMQLQGKFKLLTTGTPLENHLGELWNLFRFINPGLLGSLEQFNQRFAIPVERDRDKQASQRLRKLIHPFILRRTKTQVLSELPSRTEIVLNVELSKAEKTLYEAMRRDAIAKLADSDGPPGQQSLQVLAEIMKLRRLCCNPRLVLPDSTFGSAKLDAFAEVLAELLENNHKALVFSQFVDHLAILREHLEAQGIAYQYLDGSTPTKQRQQRVDAFQAGEGDVFLISLKAGGTGLNLTAADYVIHMDPWWNPAVEDQASDRAHRMGQQRPVTIYRLVTQGTIEEKIVELHQQKRDLADSLLEGTEGSSKLSTSDLLKLIQEA